MADSVNVRVSDSDKLYPNAVVVKVGTQEIIAGRDGVSPVVTTEAIPHGNRVTITDAVGEHAFDVMDGASAYEQAVAGGYEGTEEEFAADLIGFNTRAAEAAAGATAAAAYADAASDSATAAATSESNAADSATAAASSASGAASSAGTATTAAGSASSSATAAAGSATTASNKASEAASSESNAASSATAASASATAAAASETAAASSASSAAGSATAAAASAAAIEEYEHDAEAWAIGKRGGVDVDSSDDTYHNNSKYYAEQAAANNSAAAQKASEAASSAQAASQSAQEASASATAASQAEGNAANSATAAAGSATAAAGSASTASTAATTAQGHATNAASSATAASGSATSAASSATAAGNAQTAAETAQAAAEDAQAAAEAVLASIPSDYTELSDDVDDLKSEINNKAPVIINSASGDIASFTDGADNMPIKALTVNIEPIQAGSGDPSPDNVRPISGRTSATIYHSGADTSDPTTNTIQLGDTVYGGTLDVTQGKMLVDRAIYTFDGTENFDLITAPAPAGSFPYFRWFGSAFVNIINNWNLYNDAIMSNYPVNNQLQYWYSGGINDDVVAWTVRDNAGLCIKNTTIVSANDLKASLIGKQIAYLIANPIEITLTPTQITTLLGTNNIWSDAGDVDVDYCADTKLYIDNIHQPTDDDMTADAPIASGKYFIVGNTLYKASTTIAAGDTITPGTNCTETNLAEALNAINI